MADSHLSRGLGLSMVFAGCGELVRASGPMARSGCGAMGGYSSAGLITCVLSGSRVLVDEAADWIGERIEHSLSDLAVLSLSAAPSFYLWLLLGACPGAGAEFGI